MPATSALPAAGATEAFARAVTTTNANSAVQQESASPTAPAGAGPAAVVTISQAARDLSAGLNNKPGLNNGTMAAEGGNAAELRDLLSQRNQSQNNRLNESTAAAIP